MFLLCRQLPNMIRKMYKWLEHKIRSEQFWWLNAQYYLCGHETWLTYHIMSRFNFTTYNHMIWHLALFWMLFQPTKDIRVLQIIGWCSLNFSTWRGSRAVSLDRCPPWRKAPLSASVRTRSWWSCSTAGSAGRRRCGRWVVQILTMLQSQVVILNTVAVSGSDPDYAAVTCHTEHCGCECFKSSLCCGHGLLYWTLWLWVVPILPMLHWFAVVNSVVVSGSHSFHNMKLYFSRLLYSTLCV